jgi:hypothetical protein
MTFPDVMMRIELAIVDAPVGAPPPFFFGGKKLSCRLIASLGRHAPRERTALS